MRRALYAALLLSGCAQILDIDDRNLVERDLDAGADTGVDSALPDTSLPMSNDGGTPSPDAGRAPSCEEYCDLAEQLCTKEQGTQLFQERATCLAVCSKYAPTSTTSNNTLSCRVNLLRGLADTGSNEALTTCPGAGPGGGPPPAEPNGVNCGTNCEGFCALRAATCPLMAGDVDCVAKCSALLDSDVYNAAEDFGEGQDTLSCRIAHLSAAAYYDATEIPNAMGKKSTRDAHCSHSGIRSEVQCDFPKNIEPKCDSYCKLVQTACTGDKQVFQSTAQCLAVCAKMDPGVTGDTTSAGSRRCMRLGAYDALEGLVNGCQRASIAGDGCLGGRCASYCFFAQKSCPQAFQAQFPSNTQKECTDSCSGIDGTAANSPYSLPLDLAQSGDNIQCRLRQLTFAIEDGENSARCAAVFGGAPCN